MENPHLTIISHLQHNVEKEFALVIDGIPILFDNKQVYVKFQANRLSFFTCSVIEGTNIRKDDLVQMTTMFENIMAVAVYCQVNFSDISSSAERCTVVVNDSFRVLFLNTPIHVFLIKLIEWSSISGNFITRLQIKEYPELTENIINNWEKILSKFQADSIFRYIYLYKAIFNRKVSTKLGYDENKIFRSKIGDRNNFIHLFFTTSGLYNPFVSDKLLMSNVPLNSWLWSDESNSRLFVRSFRGFVLHCMTPLSFCKAIGLDYKLDFDFETALLILAGMLYRGSLTITMFPSPNTFGYSILDTDPDTGEVLSSNFVPESPDPSAISGDTIVTRMSTLEYFSIRYARELSHGELSRNKILEILGKAKFVSRSEE